MDRNKVWVVKPAASSQARELSEELGVSLVLAGLLIKRGINNAPAARRFLEAGWESLDSPWALAGMEEAVHRLQRAARDQEPVVVYGDYDVDGICSVVIMLNCLQAMGCQADYYIPDRFQEGYGLNNRAVEELAGRGFKLLLSVDCGINSLPEVVLAGAKGMDVIISDHHNPGGRLPVCSAVINPQLGSGPNSGAICGAGVAFYLARAWGADRLSPEMYRELLGLTALATVADVVPLLGDNRILVREGLKSLEKSQSVGIRALLQESGLKDTALDSWHLGFVLAPRLNAAGRLDNARLGVELLTTSDPGRAAFLAAALGRLNQERKALEESILAEAAAMIEADKTHTEAPAIVLAARAWHHGVLGITASRLCERFHKPVIMVGWDGKQGRGSARSIPGLNIFEALCASRDFLLRFGGHSMAAGLNIEYEQFTPFREALLAWTEQSYRDHPELNNHIIEIDDELEPDRINHTLVKELELLKPFGPGNPRPLFSLRGIEMEKVQLMGRQKEHFKCRIQSQDYECIAFNRPQYSDWAQGAHLLDLAGSLDLNRFRGRDQIQFKLLDVKSTVGQEHNEHQPDAGTHKLLVDMGRMLQQGCSVCLVFPTPRLLQRGRVWLQTYFSGRRFLEVYAGLETIIQRSDLAGLLQKKGRIILSTGAFVEFAQSKGWWPDDAPHLWRLGFPGSKAGLYENNISRGPKNVEWISEEFLFSGQERNLVYVNRPATLARWIAAFPGIMQEAGLKNDRERRAVQRDFFTGPGGLMLSDAGCIKGLQTGWKAEQVWFADAPFSRMEAFILLDYLGKGDRAVGKVLFARSALEANRLFLNTLYPEEAVIQLVWSQLQNGPRSELKEEAGHLCRELSDRIGRRIGSTEFVSILRILEELDLCQVQKKGSIIAIKLIERDILPENLSDSSFFVEGQAEKAALANFEEDIKSALDW